MFSALRRRIHLSPTTVIATLALVFAMTGGAYAAKKYLITATKQISPSVLKALQGKAGPAGAAGAQGPAGPAGSAGTKGENGSNGSNGSNGEKGLEGKAGESVTGKAIVSGGSKCNGQAGAEYTLKGATTAVCNGKEGSPWTDGGTLPAGAQETGSWNFIQTLPIAKHESSQYAVISFQVPLKTAVSAGSAHYIKFGAALPTGCKGTLEKPEAAEGNLCVFEGAINTTTATAEEVLITQPWIHYGTAYETEHKNAAGTTGALIEFYNFPEKATGEPGTIVGTWAVGGN